MKIIAISGSLRKDSFNTKALKAAARLAPADVELEVVDLASIPSYNDDQLTSMPESVIEFKNKIRNADAVLISTPEYNYSVSGVLKNAIDWASRPDDDNVWAKKPGAIMGASTGRFGTVRAQYHLRQICVSIDLRLLNQPQVFITDASTAFAEDGSFADKKTEQKVRSLIEALVEWAKLIGK
jgi:chromate reductase, NAD(P)H dehydrogenase (quinone)